MKLTRWTLIAVGVAAVIALYVGRDARGTSARVSADGWYYHVYLVSLVGDRDLDFTDEYAVTGNWYRFGAGPTGRPVNPFGIGPAIFEAPFYALGGAVAAIAGHDTAGFDRLHMTLTMLAAPLFSVAALFFVIRLLRRRLGSERQALIASLAAFLGGPMVYYAVRQPGYAHPFAFFFVAWLVDAWDASYDRPRTIRTWIASARSSAPRPWRGRSSPSGACSSRPPSSTTSGAASATRSAGSPARRRRSSSSPRSSSPGSRSTARGGSCRRDRGSWCGTRRRGARCCSRRGTACSPGRRCSPSAASV
jgi:hypothetical protein